LPATSSASPDEQVAPVRKPLEGLPATNAEGKADIAVLLPALPKTSRPLEADVILKLRESGGRTIERTVTLPIDLKSPRVGIKALFKGGQAEEGEFARFEAILLGPDGKAIEAKGLKWELMRLDQRWQWYSRDGSWNYRAVTARAAWPPARPMPRRARRPRSRPSRLGPLSPRSQRLPTVRLSSPAWCSAPAIGRRGRRQPGECSTWRSTSHPTGRRDRPRQDRLAHGRARADRGDELRPRQHQEVDLPAGGGEVPIRVGDDWNPGAYVTVMLYRPMDEKAKRMPAGHWAALARVDQAPRMLKVSLDAPEKVKSGAMLTVPIKGAGLARARRRVSRWPRPMWASSTSRASRRPSLKDWFFGQRRLGTEIRDVYGRLIDGMRAETRQAALRRPTARPPAACP
jgi:hypothetical protein